MSAAAAAARRWIFITHANVLIEPKVPVPDWALSPRGRVRMRGALRQPWTPDVTAVYSSRERKSIEGAQLLADHLGLPLTTVAELGENDRSSTGFLPPPQFERMADAFFAQPEVSVRGWERAVDAQARIVAAVQAIDRSERSGGAVAIVSHGAVGTLLQCWLSGRPISRQWDQPGNGGGNWYAFTLEPRQALGPWRALDEAAAGQGGA